MIEKEWHWECGGQLCFVIECYFALAELVDSAEILRRGVPAIVISSGLNEVRLQLEILGHCESANLVALHERVMMEHAVDDARDMRTSFFLIDNQASVSH